ncbi:MAG: hypothetical protein RMI91_09340 [Gemmatales bacterium]|nr:hypothetical protein [Gemmatales bacterium]MDW7994844.1 hypothetical protein [Gemmatales bacterium]
MKHDHRQFLPVLPLAVMLGAGICLIKSADELVARDMQFPEHVVRAWQAAGADVGWLTRDKHSGLAHFDPVKRAD